MRQSAEQIAAFYETRLGRAAAGLLIERTAALWTVLAGETVLGLGEVRHLAGPLTADAASLALVDLHASSPLPWGGHRNRGNVVLAAHETRLPFADQAFSRVILLHALEEAEDPRRLIREVWRVTAEEGRILVIAASRGGLWSRAEATPFGHGRPWTRTQLWQLLEAGMFQPTAWAHALHMPPLDWGVIAGAASAWERTGQAFWLRLGGVVMVEAVKRLVITPNAPARQGARQARSVPAVTGIAVSRPQSRQHTIDTPEEKQD